MFTRATVAMFVTALSISAVMPLASEARPISPQDRAKAEALKKSKSDCDYYKDMADKHHVKKNKADAAGDRAAAARELASENYLTDLANAAGCKWAGGTLY